MSTTFTTIVLGSIWHFFDLVPSKGTVKKYPITFSQYIGGKTPQ